jgi:hypothetical protein
MLSLGWFGKFEPNLQFLLQVGFGRASQTPIRFVLACIQIAPQLNTHASCALPALAPK